METFLDKSIDTVSSRITAAVSELAVLNSLRQNESTFVDAVNKMPQAANVLLQNIASYISLVNARNEMITIAKSQEVKAEQPEAP